MARALLGFCAAFLFFPALGEMAKGDDKAVDGKASKQKLRFFETKIRPVLVKHCYECHSAEAEEAKGGLLLDSKAGIRRGGDSGHAVVPGNVSESLLIDALNHDGFEMPPEEKLPAGVINDFVRWVKTGAADPRIAGAPPLAAAKPQGALWSLTPIANPPTPTTASSAASSDWPRSDIDRFILTRQQAAGVLPTADAKPSALLRRLYFDLVGLPPTLDDIAAFQHDHSQQAVERLVDKLLNSPQFGERWARHWLDVVRYAESAGNSRDVLMPYAWRYRDYVIDAFNADAPYNQFIQEQIAGDLLPAETPAQRDRLNIATGMLAIGSKSLNGGNLGLDIPDDQIDVIGKAMLGLTISCARCHDHKFDPIPTSDYYALAGIFRSTETLYGGSTKRPKNIDDQIKVYLPLDADRAVIQQATATQKKISKLQKQATPARKQASKLARKLPKDWKTRKPELTKPNAELSPQDNKLLKQIVAYEKAKSKGDQLKSRLRTLQDALPKIEFAVGVRDAKKPRDWPIQIRGERTNAGKKVARGFLSCVPLANPPKINGAAQSGRLELAQWLTHAEHPLTSRVIVNRVWQHLFGEGLVRTVDNFGVNGEPPTHPELLDYLARRFMNENGWSIKSLIREIVATRTYQLSTNYDQAAYTADAENKLLWRMNRRRLEAEPLRDALLAASGNLDLSRLEGSLVMEIGEGEVGRGIKTACLSEPFHHRGVYLPIIRGLVPEHLKMFDLPEPSNVQGKRDATNVPAQSLYLMNSPFVSEQAQGLASRILRTAENQEDRLNLLYQICLARKPTPSEVAQSKQFLQAAAAETEAKKSEESERFVWSMLSQAMFSLAEFRFID